MVWVRGEHRVCRYDAKCNLMCHNPFRELRFIYILPFIECFGSGI